MFGPAPAQDGQGYVWTGAFSTEGSTTGISPSTWPAMIWQVGSSSAALRRGSTTSSMGNAGITGDHDGNAIVLQLGLRRTRHPQPPSLKTSPVRGRGTVTGKVTAVDPDKDQLTYAGMTTDKGTVTVTSTGSFTYTPTATPATPPRRTAPGNWQRRTPSPSRSATDSAA